jgi:hypothetical protein
VNFDTGGGEPEMKLHLEKKGAISVAGAFYSTGSFVLA